MAQKTFNSRIINKHDTEANWLKATNFIPRQGEIIIYDTDSTHSYERFKIGDGVTVVSSLPFADETKVNAADLADIAYSGSWNDLEDKPFYEEEVNVNANVPLTALSTNLMVTTYNYISEVNPIDAELLSGTTYEVTLQGFDTNGELVIEHYDEFCIAYDYNSHAALGSADIVSGVSGAVVSVPELWFYGYVDDGYYLVLQSGESDVASAKFTITGTNIVPLDLKFTPEAITNLIVSGKNITYTKGNGTTGTITTQDTNTIYYAGTGISLSGTTFSNSGVRSISTGTTNGTISVNKNGTSADVAVKGLGSAAYTESTAYDTAGSANTALTNAKSYTDTEITEFSNNIITDTMIDEICAST